MNIQFAYIIILLGIPYQIYLFYKVVKKTQKEELMFGPIWVILISLLILLYVVLVIDLLLIEHTQNTTILCFLGDYSVITSISIGLKIIRDYFEQPDTDELHGDQKES